MNNRMGVGGMEFDPHNDEELKRQRAFELAATRMANEFTPGQLEAEKSDLEETIARRKSAGLDTRVREARLEIVERAIELNADDEELLSKYVPSVEAINKDDDALREHLIRQLEVLGHVSGQAREASPLLEEQKSGDVYIVGATDDAHENNDSQSLRDYEEELMKAPLWQLITQDGKTFMVKTEGQEEEHLRNLIKECQEQDVEILPLASDAAPGQQSAGATQGFEGGAEPATDIMSTLVSGDDAGEFEHSEDKPIGAKQSKKVSKKHSRLERSRVKLGSTKALAKDEVATEQPTEAGSVAGGPLTMGDVIPSVKRFDMSKFKPTRKVAAVALSMTLAGAAVTYGAWTMLRSEGDRVAIDKECFDDNPEAEPDVRLEAGATSTVIWEVNNSVIVPAFKTSDDKLRHQMLEVKSIPVDVAVCAPNEGSEAIEEMPDKVVIHADQLNIQARIGQGEVATDMDKYVDPAGIAGRYDEEKLFDKQQGARWIMAMNNQEVIEKATQETQRQMLTKLPEVQIKSEAEAQSLGSAVLDFLKEEITNTTEKSVEIQGDIPGVQTIGGAEGLDQEKGTAITAAEDVVMRIKDTKVKGAQVAPAEQPQE